MFCTKCGKEIMEEAVICPNCGVKTKNATFINNLNTQPSNYQYFQNQNSDVSMANTFGIISIIVGWFIPLIGWIFGGLGISRLNSIKEYNEMVQKAKSLNTIGLVISSFVGVVEAVIMIVVFMM